MKSGVHTFAAALLHTRRGGVAILLVPHLFFSAPTGSTASAIPQLTAAFGCAPLPAAEGPTVTLGPSDAGRLPGVVAGAAPGTTILLQDGTYALNGRVLAFRQSGVTMRSVSNDATAVLIDGGYKTPEIAVVNASNVTLAHVTLARAIDHLVHAYPVGDAPVRNLRLFGLHLIDSGEQFVKANPNAARSAFVDEGRVECSLFRLTDEGRPHVERQGGRSCYTGGIDVHAGFGWSVRLSRFEDIYCRPGPLAEHAIHFWTGSSGTLVENNTILNCARGIGFGLGPSGAGRQYPADERQPLGYVGHRGGLIRNNVIFADVPEYDTGIGLEQAWGVRVVHNTVFAAAGARRAFSAIDVRFGNTSAELLNNLVTNITVRQGGRMTGSNNLDRVSADAFVNVPARNLHLRTDYAPAVDRGLVIPDAGLDMDGQKRGSAPDIGADEVSKPGVLRPAAPDHGRLPQQ